MAHFGEAAERENERVSVSYEAMLSEAARNLVNQASLDLQGDIASVRAECVRAVAEVQALVRHVYFLLAFSGALFLAGLVALVVLLLVR